MEIEEGFCAYHMHAISPVPKNKSLFKKLWLWSQNQVVPASSKREAQGPSAIVTPNSVMTNLSGTGTHTSDSNSVITCLYGTGTHTSVTPKCDDSLALRLPS